MAGDPQTKPEDPELAEFALRLGDDALILGQRLCEWCAKAPTLEEDIAIANVGLDYFGRARMALQYAGSLLHSSEDELAFLRDSADFRNLLMAELPNGDFAFTMVRHFLLDEFEVLYFAKLCHSSDATLAAIANKTIKEVTYHQRRSREWLRRLALGTEESQARTEAALTELWGYTGELFYMDSLEKSLVTRGIAVDREGLREHWQLAVNGMLAEIELLQPNSDWQVSGGRQGVHTEHLGHLLSEMQFLQRAYPGLSW